MSLYKSVLRILSFLLILVLFCGCGKELHHYIDVYNYQEHRARQVDKTATAELLSAFHKVDVSTCDKYFQQTKGGIISFNDSFEADDVNAYGGVSLRPLPRVSTENVKDVFDKKYYSVEVENVGISYQPAWLDFKEEKYWQGRNYPYALEFELCIARDEASYYLTVNFLIDNKETKHLADLSEFMVEKINESIKEDMQKFTESSNLEVDEF